MRYEGDEIIVGSLALLAEHGISRGLPGNSNGAGGASKSAVARAGQLPPAASGIR